MSLFSNIFIDCHGIPYKSQFDHTLSICVDFRMWPFTISKQSRNMNHSLLRFQRFDDLFHIVFKLKTITKDVLCVPQLSSIFNHFHHNTDRSSVWMHPSMPDRGWPDLLMHPLQHTCPDHAHDHMRGMNRFVQSSLWFVCDSAYVRVLFRIYSNMALHTCTGGTSSDNLCMQCWKSGQFVY